MKKVCGHKQCRRAGERLDLDQFPRNRRRDDGRHPYCRECSRRQMREGRARITAMKEAQRIYGVQSKPTQLPLAMDPLAEVYEAIANGRTTRETIQKKTHLTYDQIGDVLALLVFDFRAVKIQNREFLLVDRESVAA